MFFGFFCVFFVHKIILEVFSSLLQSLFVKKRFRFFAVVGPQPTPLKME